MRNSILFIAAFLITFCTGFYFLYRYIQDSDKLSEALQERLSQGNDTLSMRSSYECLQYPALVRELYTRNKFSPLWISKDSLSAYADSLCVALQAADREGLYPENYHALFLQETIEEFRATRRRVAQRIDIQSDLELVLTDALISYIADLSVGSVKAKEYNAYREERLQKLELVMELPRAFTNGNLPLMLRTAAPGNLHYIGLRQALAMSRRIQAGGGYTRLYPQRYYRYGDRAEGITRLRKRLQESGIAASTSGDAWLYDSVLVTQVQLFQKLHGLKANGMLDAAMVQAMNTKVEDDIRTLTVNMERLRWLPAAWADRRIQVNIAAFAMILVENDSIRLESNVVVGLPYRQTPVFNASLEYLVLNPYWEVPPNIARFEILPAVKRNPNYLEEHYLEVLDVKTKRQAVLDPTQINWDTITADNFRYRFRQQPGPWNALGTVKFIFPNKFNVYMHDTPERKLFEQTVRSYSHGCIRLEKPMELALYLLRQHRGWDSARIEETIAGQEPKFIRLHQPIPVYITYFTSWISPGGQLHFRNDIYGQDKTLLQLMEQERNTCKVLFTK